MDISTFSAKMKSGDTDATDLRLVFQSVKCPQHGTGVRFKHDGFKLDYDLVHLRTKSGDNITDKTIYEDIDTVKDIDSLPRPYLVSVGLVIQKVDNFLAGQLSDINLLAKSGVTVNGFIFKK